MIKVNIYLTLIDFEDNAHITFRQLWNDQDFTDVTIVSVELQMKEHKVIVCSDLWPVWLLTQKNLKNTQIQHTHTEHTKGLKLFCDQCDKRIVEEHITLDLTFMIV